MAETPMHFDKYGRTYHLRIESARDLEHVLELNDALWIATSARISSLNCDREFLDFVDLDDNGIVRCDEVRAAVRWTLDRLSDAGPLAEGTDEVGLGQIGTDDPAGRRLLETARYVNGALGVGGREAIGLDQIDAFEELLDRHPINGDGVIPPGASEDPEVNQFIGDIVACTGGRQDRGGRMGATAEQLETFLADAAAYLDWLARVEDDSAETTDAMPLGEETVGAYQALEAIEAKVEEFFALCRTLRFLGTSEGVVPEARVGVLADVQGAESINEQLEGAPLARPTAEEVLPLREGVNPAWRDRLEEFAERAVKPVLGERDELTPEDWGRIEEFFAGHKAWLAAKKGASVEMFDKALLRSYLDGDQADKVRELLAADAEVADQFGTVRDLRKLLLCHKHLLRFLNNFVSFPELYAPDRRAMFEMGSLVIDGRWFNFAVEVENVEEHRKVARAGGMYVMYVGLTRKTEEEKTTVAVPATSGTVGNLCVGKRGVFQDVRGDHYQARVIDIIENPVSFREALTSPFVRLGRFVVGKIEAMSSTAQKELEARLGTATRAVQQSAEEAARQSAEAAQARQQAAAQASASRRDILLGASVSIAALTSAFAFITKTLAGLQVWQVVVAALVAVGLVLLPTAIVAAVKLRRRDLSAILEGCGWAINARMRLNRRQRKQFTRQEPYPAEATGTPRRRWFLVVCLVILLGLLAFLGFRMLREARSPVEKPAQAVEREGDGEPTDFTR
ncbi:MAG: hypothetical protein R6X33_03635 [Candidatus Brocadiia bacterium]